MIERFVRKLNDIDQEVDKEMTHSGMNYGILKTGRRRRLAYRVFFALCLIGLLGAMLLRETGKKPEKTSV